MRDSTRVFEVAYYSLTGNTRKVAEAIAAGLYGPLRGWGLKRFIEKNDFRGREVALFGASGEGKGKELRALEEALATQGAEITGRFFCSGEFLFLVNRKRPNSTDLGDAKRFAREMAED
jgi:flavodoxin